MDLRKFTKWDYMMPVMAGKGLDDSLKLPGVTGLAPVWFWNSVCKTTVSIILPCSSVRRFTR